MICPDCKTEMWQSTAPPINGPNPHVCLKCGRREHGDVIEVPNASPPLMIVIDKPISNSVRQAVREQIEAKIKAGGVIVIDPTATFYQLVDGRWQAIHGAEEEGLEGEITEITGNVVGSQKKEYEVTIRVNDEIGSLQLRDKVMVRRAK